MTTKDTNGDVGGVPSGSRSEYGDLIPIRLRPATPPTRCLRGHRLDLGGMTVTSTACTAFSARSAASSNHDPPPRALAEWAYTEVSVRKSAGDALAFGLALVVEPPPRRGGAGCLQLRLDGITTARIDVTLCGSCRRGAAHTVYVEERYRRLGYARTLVAAALALQPTYAWTTESNPHSVASRAFWTTTGLPRSPFKDRCPHTS
jgi:GNAT superfamily N-acetyltransferase